MAEYMPITQTDVPMPRWEITDPFGRAAIRKARWEYLRKAAQCESYRLDLEDTLNKQGEAVKILSEELRKAREKCDELDRRFRYCDDARKSLGEKVTALRIENGSLAASKIIAETLAKLNGELEEKLDRLKADYKELEEAHEQLLRLATNKEEEIK